MKRLIGLVALTTFATAALAQAPFTIVRPADGSKIREKVKILIPKNSIPKGGYVGINVGGKFLEATKLPLVGRYYEYTLDTKGKGIPDGKVNVEAVLYVDYNGEPRIVDRSSVDVTVANKANIPIPANGFKLRYYFQPGQQLVYTLMQRVSLATLTRNQARSGGSKAAQLPLEFEKIRMMYSVDNTYESGAGVDGLIRMQPIPLKGKDHLFLTPAGASVPQVFDEHDVYPIYMRLSNTGTEVYGSVPAFVPFEGLTPPQVITNLFAAYPLPSFPTKGVRPGDKWQTRFQLGDVRVNDVHNQRSVVQAVPAVGEFAGIEWEMGHPCAKIVHKIEVQPRGQNRLSLEEVIYYALDENKVVKVIRTLFEDQDTTVRPNAPAANGGTANRPAPGRGNGPSIPSTPGGGGPRRGSGAPRLNGPPPPPEEIRQGGPRRSARGGGDQPPPAGGPGTSTATRNSGRNNQPGAPTGPALAIIRYTVQQIFVLEQ